MYCVPCACSLYAQSPCLHLPRCACFQYTPSFFRRCLFIQLPVVCMCAKSARVWGGYELRFGSKHDRWGVLVVELRCSASECV